MSDADDIAAFWDWWRAESAELVERMRDRTTSDAAAEAIGERIAALGLRPSVLPAGDDDIRVVASADYDPALRRRAELWLEAAVATEGAEFATTRPPAGEEFLREAMVPRTDGPLRIADMRFTTRWHERSGLGALVGFWPGGETLPRDDATQLAFLTLEAALGEQRSSAWVDDLELLHAPPSDGVDPVTFAAAFAEMVAKRERVTWTVLVVTPRDGSPRIITLRQPLLPAMHPRCNTYLGVIFETDDGGVELGRALEDQLLEGIADGEPGGPIHAGGIRQAGGRETMVYVDPDHASTALLLDRAKALGAYDVYTEHDPDWDMARQYGLAEPARVPPPEPPKRRWFGRGRR